MELKKLKTVIPGFVYKYKYAIIVLLVGLILMLFPTGKNETPVQTAHEQLKSEKTLEEQLSALLSCVSGAGRVQVLLTTETGEEQIYQLDEEKTGTGQNKTVTVTDSQRNETGLIRMINATRYRGAIIVCDGAEDSVTRLALVQAVSNATGLGTDKISVLKMK